MKKYRRYKPQSIWTLVKQDILHPALESTLKLCGCVSSTIASLATRLLFLTLILWLTLKILRLM